MKEIRLNIGSFWENSSNIDSDINSINWNIENNKGKKIIIDLPISYFDSSFFKNISDLNAIEFESRNGRRYKPNDILMINNKLIDMTSNINNSILSPFEKFISIYSFVVNYKFYKQGNDKYPDIGRSPYLFLNDDYINCVGICQFLCILCRQIGINITMLADELNKHAICYFYIKDEKYGIDGYFYTDPTNDTKSDINSEIKYNNMIRRITFKNDFEKFLNSNVQLFYPRDIVDISLFSKYILFLKTNNSFIESSEKSIDLLYRFREEYRTKQNYISYDIIYDAISQVESLGYIPSIKGSKDDLKNLLFIQEVEEKALMGESTEDLISYFVNSTINKKSI